MIFLPSGVLPEGQASQSPSCRVQRANLSCKAMVLLVLETAVSMCFSQAPSPVLTGTRYLVFRDEFPPVWGMGKHGAFA